MTPSQDRKALLAHAVPFALFIAGLGLSSLVAKGAPADGGGSLLVRHPEFWVYPLQTTLCAFALAIFWKSYDFGRQRSLLLAAGVGLVVFVLWVSPQLLFGQPPRVDGFDPTKLEFNPALYWCSVTARFLRLAIVVPLLEEIFWRGFLQRYLIDEHFTRVPFGKYTPFSFWAVAIAFMLEHSPADYPAALATGAIYGWLAVRTKTLLAPIVAHAVTNLVLGIYVMKTGQWGFW